MNKKDAMKVLEDYEFTLNAVVLGDAMVIKGKGYGCVEAVKAIDPDAQLKETFKPAYVKGGGRFGGGAQTKDSHPVKVIAINTAGSYKRIDFTCKSGKDKQLISTFFKKDENGGGEAFKKIKDSLLDIFTDDDDFGGLEDALNGGEDTIVLSREDIIVQFSEGKDGKKNWAKSLKIKE